jgi:hypothetical protein
VPLLIRGKGSVQPPARAHAGRSAPPPAAAPAFAPALAPAPAQAASRLRFLTTCANPGCSTGWLHLWRSRSAPIFEGGWSCSAACTQARVTAALARELEGRTVQEETHRHRVPLGLLMLEQGWIGIGELRQALDAQRAAATGKLGQWLVRQQGVSEQLVTRALGLQWSCPVLPLEFHDPQAVAACVPRLFLDAYRALPLRSAAGRLLYLGFEDRLDPVLALAVERMTGVRVECGLVRDSLFRSAHARMLEARFPAVELFEAESQPAAARAFAEAIEGFRSSESRLVRVHNLLWLRLWRRSHSQPVQDLICSLGAQ